MSAVSREQAIREGAAAHLTEQHKKQRVSIDAHVAPGCPDAEPVPETQILSHTVQWDKYANNKTLTNKHITALEAYDKRGPEVQEACLNTEVGLGSSCFDVATTLSDPVADCCHPHCRRKER